MIDGTVARKTGTVSEFGSKLDTVADLILVNSGSTACAVATFAAIQEGHLIRTGAEKNAP